MLYIQYKNSHITNDLKNIPVNNLKINDQVIILQGENEAFVHCYKLIEIKYDKIYIFDNSNNSNSNSNFNGTYNTSAHFEAYYLYTYNDNNSLIYLFEKNCECYYETYCDDNLMDDIGVAIYNDCKNKTIICNSLTIKNIDKDKINNKIFNYIIIPLNSQNFMCLLKTFSYNGILTYNQDYILFGEYIDKSDKTFKKLKNPENYEFRMFINKIKRNDCNITPILEQLKNNLSYDVSKFEEILFACNYKLNHYLRDLNRDINIEKVQETFNKLDINFNIKKAYIPVFIHKSGFKSYHFNENVVVTINDELINWNSFFYKDVVVSSQKSNYTAKVPIELKNNEKNQILYEIAHGIAEFECSGKNHINPRTGDHYINGKIDNNKIVYKDFKSLILIKNNNKFFYIKKYGFFIRTTDKKEIEEIEERYQIITKLTE